MKRLSSLFVVLALIGCAASSLPSGYRALPSLASKGKGDNPTVFTVSGNNILLNGNAFYIKGVDYAPTQICQGPGGASSYPLSDGNSAIWSADLNHLRKLGANAIKVYNVATTATGAPVKIGKFLKAAYNGGKKPIYTILSIWIPAGVIDNGAHPNAVTAIASQYYQLAKTYGTNPDVMGISIGGEWNQHPDIGNKATWKKGVNPIIQQAWDGLIAAGVGNQKLLTTTLQNDLGGAYAATTMGEGEKYHFPPTPKPTGSPYYGATAEFAWGFDIYSGLATTLQYVKTNNPTRPFIVAEWGEPAGYHPAPSSSPYDVTEWPSATVSTLTNYLTSQAQTIYNSSTVRHQHSGVDSGGFYFEWSDEYWKAYATPTTQQLCTHSGGGLSVNPNPVAGFPSGFDDEAWFGLNAIATPSPGSSAPADPMSPRPDFYALQAQFAASTPR